MSYDKPISYSGKKLFKQCPKRWHNTYVLGQREPSGPAAERGTRLHEKLEKFFIEPHRGYPKDDKVLAPWRRVMEALTLYSPTPEANLAVDKDWSPVAYDDPAAFYRGKADLMFTTCGELHIHDFKSGRKYPEHEEQGLSYVALSAEYPRMHTCFTYLDHPLDMLEFTYTPTQREDHIAGLINEINEIRATTEFLPKANDGCKWCPLSWRKGGDCHAAP